jgi:hypothetical protein
VLDKERSAKAPRFVNMLRAVLRADLRASLARAALDAVAASRPKLRRAVELEVASVGDEP